MYSHLSDFSSSYDRQHSWLCLVCKQDRRKYLPVLSPRRSTLIQAKPFPLQAKHIKAYYDA